MVQGVEIASVIVNLGVFTATVIAAIIAWRSVVDAREARDEARTAEQEAAAAAIRSATASERSAEALERQVELAEDAARTPSWTISEAHAAGRRWKFTNTSRHQLTEVSVDFNPRGVVTVERAIPDPVAIGQSFLVEYNTYATIQVRVDLTWRNASGVQETERFSIH